MAPPTPTASPNNTPNATAAPRVPPDEQFWQRYSPHHEFPLSGVTSAALHVLVVALLLLAAWVAYRLGWGQEKEPLPVTAVRVEGGGGGNRQGVGDAPGKGDTAAPVEDRQVPPTDTPRPQPQVKLNNLDPGKADPLVPKVRDDHGQNDVKPIQDATKTLQGIQKDALDKAFKNLAGKGQGGSGRGGGEGTGTGPGTGPGVGPGTGTISERQRRALSWIVIFSTQSGEDYLRQLANIKPGNGAILAIPQADGTFRVIRDLHKHPATGAVEDISQIHRIYWVDDKPESVASLSHALGIPVPSAIVAFFPQELEQELAKLEHDYKGLKGSQIKETRFSVIANGDGTYHAAVLSQTPQN